MSNNVYANEADELETKGRCAACGCLLRDCECDPTPWCHACGATRKADCECRPIADDD